MKFFYHNENKYGEILFCILLLINFLKKIQDSRHSSIMIDESTDLYVTCYFVVFASYVDENFAIYVFIGLWQMKDEKIDTCIIFET